jgi:hypothetical protein
LEILPWYLHDCPLCVSSHSSFPSFTRAHTIWDQGPILMNSCNLIIFAKTLFLNKVTK